MGSQPQIAFTIVQGFGRGLPEDSSDLLKRYSEYTKFYSFNKKRTKPHYTHKNATAYEVFANIPQVAIINALKHPAIAQEIQWRK